MSWGKALSISISRVHKGCFRPKSSGLGNQEARMLLLFLSAGWELRSHAPWAWDRLRLSQKQSKDRGLDLYCCLSLPKLAPRQLGHCSPLWYLYPSLHLHSGTSWFDKHNHLPQPPPKEAHIGKCFF